MTSFDDDFVPDEIVDLSSMVVNDCKEFKKDIMDVVMNAIKSDNSLNYPTISLVLEEVVAQFNVMAMQSKRIDEILEEIH